MYIYLSIQILNSTYTITKNTYAAICSMREMYVIIFLHMCICTNSFSLICTHRTGGMGHDRVECVVSSTSQDQATILINKADTVFQDLKQNLESVTVIESFNSSGTCMFTYVHRFNRIFLPHTYTKGVLHRCAKFKNFLCM